MSDKKLKIAVYSGEIPSTTFIERLINGLSEHAIIILFGQIKTKGTYLANVKVNGYRNTRFSKLYYFLKYWVLLTVFKTQAKRKLDKLIKAKAKNQLHTKLKFYPVLWEQPDIFHVQWAKGIEEWMWVKDFGIKLILSLRGAHINYSPIADTTLARMYKSNFPMVDGFHAVSKAIAKEAEKYDAEPSKIKVVYSGLQEFSNANTTFTKPFNILSVGRPHWKKGYTYALDACYLLKAQGFDFNYTIIGAENDLELLYQIQDLKLQEQVKLLPKLSFTAVKKHMEAATLLILPSVEEGIANVVLEAMAYKTLVLTTNCGGMEEVVIHRKNGFIVPVRNPKAITDTIIEISKIPESQVLKIIDNAYNTVNQQHNHAQMINGMLKLYKSVMS